MKQDLKYVYDVENELALLDHARSLLFWDKQCYMPQGGSKHRAESVALISKLRHERFSSNKFWQAIQRLHKDSGKLKQKDSIVVERSYKEVSKARKLSPEFVSEFSKVKSLADDAWQKARKNSDFSIFLPHLEKVLDYVRKYCELIDKNKPSYQVLSDDYEEGLGVEKIRKSFEWLKPELISLLNRIKKSDNYQNNKLLMRKFPIQGQEKLNSFVIDKMQIPWSLSRLDKAAHPFTSGISPEDVRFTTRYSDNPFESLTSTVHEAGHALYILGYNKKYENTLSFAAASYGLHESQSRFWENAVCKSPQFLRAFYSHFKKEFPQQMKNVSVDDFVLGANDVRPSFIRIEADEVTYCLHIILRFELELDMLAGKIKLDDLPNLWNEKMKKYFGIEPKNDAEGVLQDVHWSWGAVGYFPSYAIGSIYYSQIDRAMRKEHANYDKLLGTMNFKPLLDWLRTNIHSYNNIITAEEIMKKATGSGLDPKVYIDYLDAKYSEIYDL